jgi:hypothetical protein
VLLAPADPVDVRSGDGENLARARPSPYGEDMVASPRPYDPRNLQSLFGYGRAAHVRSGGICQLCGCGKDRDLDFDMWRQFTIEHLIGQGDGGYPDRINAAVARKLGDTVSLDEQTRLARDIHEANIVTACQFCNSTTSRDRSPFTMEDLILGAPSDLQSMYQFVVEKLQAILERKRAVVAWKLEATRAAFDTEIAPALQRRRAEEPKLLDPWTLQGLDVEDTAPPP